MKEDELKQLLKRWPDETLPDGMFDRVVRRAMATPQRKSWRDHLFWFGEQIFGYQQRSFAYRCTILLICVMAGFASGSARHHGGSDVLDPQTLALGDDILGIHDLKEEL